MDTFLYDVQLYGINFLIGLIAFMFLWGIFKLSILQPHSNWNHLLDNFNFSSKEFYSRLEEGLQLQGIKKVDTYTVSLKIGGPFSSRRRYLRVEWKSFRYDICAAPFGKGFFISWWVLHKNPIMKMVIAKIPFLGEWLSEKWYPITHYKIDSASMFMTYCQSSVLKVIDDITIKNGLRLLNDDERKPILNNIFKR